MFTQNVDQMKMLYASNACHSWLHEKLFPGNLLGYRLTVERLAIRCLKTFNSFGDLDTRASTGGGKKWTQFASSFARASTLSC